MQQLLFLIQTYISCLKGFYFLKCNIPDDDLSFYLLRPTVVDSYDFEKMLVLSFELTVRLILVINVSLKIPSFVLSTLSFDN